MNKSDPEPANALYQRAAGTINFDIGSLVSALGKELMIACLFVILTIFLFWFRVQDFCSHVPVPDHCLSSKCITIIE